MRGVIADARRERVGHALVFFADARPLAEAFRRDLARGATGGEIGRLLQELHARAAAHGDVDPLQQARSAVQIAEGLGPLPDDTDTATTPALEVVPDASNQ